MLIFGPTPLRQVLFLRTFVRLFSLAMRLYICSICCAIIISSRNIEDDILWQRRYTKQVPTRGTLKPAVLETDSSVINLGLWPVFIWKQSLYHCESQSRMAMDDKTLEA